MTYSEWYRHHRNETERKEFAEFFDECMALDPDSSANKYAVYHAYYMHVMRGPLRILMKKQRLQKHMRKMHPQLSETPSLWIGVKITRPASLLTNAEAQQEVARINKPVRLSE